MKNFSTVGARFVIAALFFGATAVPAGAATCAFLPNAPDQHLVVKGDTLWDISGRFLEHPWCWGQVWGLNREQIRDPHWIYPGQTIYFDRKNGRLSLSPVSGDAGDGGTGLPVTRLSPQLRTEGMGRDALHTIAAGAIEPFLSRPLIVEDAQLAAAPRIVATAENHVFLGKNDKAYVTGELLGNTAFDVFRQGQPLKDPVTGKVLAYEAFFLGSLKLQAPARAGADVQTFVVTNSTEEMGVGDRLMPALPMPLLNYVPHPPERAVDARVMSIYGGVTHAGQNQIVTVNRGSLDGLDIGSVLQLYHVGKTIDDPTAAKRWLRRAPQLKLPDEQYGDLFIFRVFKHVSYGLIMRVTEPVEVGDVALSPE